MLEKQKEPPLKKPISQISATDSKTISDQEIAKKEANKNVPTTASNVVASAPKQKETKETKETKKPKK